MLCDKAWTLILNQHLSGQFSQTIPLGIVLTVNLRVKLFASWRDLSLGEVLMSGDGF